MLNAIYYFREGISRRTNRIIVFVFRSYNIFDYIRVENVTSISGYIFGICG